MAIFYRSMLMLPQIRLPFWPMIKNPIPVPAPIQKLIRYHVYDPSPTFIGTARIQTEGGTLVVYLTEAQARMYVTNNVIGLIPWVQLPYNLRKIVSSFHKGRFAPDLPPVVNAPLIDKTATANSAMTPYQFAANTFWDPDDHTKTLTYTAVRIASNGKDTALPSWLTFNASTRTFSGTPPTGSAGTYNIKVYAYDPWGRRVSDVFTITVS